MNTAIFTIERMLYQLILLLRKELIEQEDICMSHMLKGIYFSIEDALAAIDNLKEQGHTPSEITVVASEDFHESFPHSIDAGTKLDSDVIFDEVGKNLSLWDKVTGFFTVSSEYDEDDYTTDSLKEVLYPYKKEINDGNIAVLVKRRSHNKTHLA